MFPSYAENPIGYKFEGQDDDEKILLLLRAHPVTNVPWIVTAVIIFFLPFAIPFVYGLLLPIGINLNVIPDTVFTSFIIINYLVVLVIVFEGFLYWYFNVDIITDRKVVDFAFESVLYKSVDLAPLAKIEETDSNTAGVIGTVFDFGDVSVQTAGKNIAIALKDIPHPAQVADFIIDVARKVPRE